MHHCKFMRDLIFEFFNKEAFYQKKLLVEICFIMQKELDKYKN